MAKFRFNVHGYLFQDGVNVLRMSFLSATEALAQDVERAEEEAFGYQQELDQGGDWIGEVDDDGHVLWDQAKVLTMRVEAAEEASMALRKAYAIAVYHHWERSARTWTGRAHGKHDVVASLVSAKGYSIHPRLTAVRDLANALKHDADKWGTALQSSWPDVFGSGFQPNPKKTDWYQAVRLTKAHVLDAFDIVSGSGPTSSS